MTERLHFHFSLSYIGEGNVNPLQYSCLENPMDRGAWRATVHGVAKSHTRLKQLSTHAGTGNKVPHAVGQPSPQATAAESAAATRESWHAAIKTTPVLLPGKSHGQRSLVGCSPWGRTESDTTDAT